jgi:hypothetical protein
MLPAERLLIHKWAVKCNLTAQSAMLAQQLAVMADPCFEIVQALREGKLDSHLPPHPSPAKWLRMYHRHRDLARLYRDQVGTPIGDGKEAQQQIDFARRWSRQIADLSDPEKVEALKKLLSPPARQGATRTFIEKIRARLACWFGRRSEIKTGASGAPKWLTFGLDLFKPCRLLPPSYIEHLVAMKELLGPVDLMSEDGLGEKVMESAHMLFFMEVLLPCHVEYQCTPLALLKHARQGDLNSVEKLIRLDPTMIHDPKVAIWMNEGMRQNRLARAESALHWGKDGLGGRFDAMAVRQTFAGLISFLGDTLCFRNHDGKLEQRGLTAAEILKLFDAVNADRRELGSTYPDVEGWHDMYPDSWKKQIQRRRKLWKDRSLIGVDKSRPK